MKIFIAAGHGAGDPGAVSQGTNEATEVINLVNQAVDLLRKVQDATHEIIQVPNDFNLRDEVATINRDSTNATEDIAIEVHMNSNSGTPGAGIEVYWGDQILANTLKSVLIKETGMKDRGAKEGNYLYFNNATSPRSALLEMGFINNPKDLEVIRSKGAIAVAKAIANAVGLSDPSGSTPASTTGVGSTATFNLLQKIIDFLQSLQKTA